MRIIFDFNPCLSNYCLAGAVLAQAEPLRLNAWGWTVMILSIGSVLALVTYCITKVLGLPPVEQEHLKGPLDIDTKDTENAD